MGAEFFMAVKRERERERRVATTTVYRSVFERDMKNPKVRERAGSPKQAWSSWLDCNSLLISQKSLEYSIS